MRINNRDIATHDETYKAMKEVLTPNFFNYMVKHCLNRLSNVFKIKYNFDRGIRGITIDDMIQETLESLLKEEGRNWYKDKFDNIKLQIISSLDSVISNTVHTHIEKDGKTFEIYENDEVEIINNEEYEQLLNSCIDELEKLNSTDEEILLFEPYVIHGMKRQDLAKLFGISLSELTNIKKRLDRKLPILKSKLKELRYEK